MHYNLFKIANSLGMQRWHKIFSFNEINREPLSMLQHGREHKSHSHIYITSVLTDSNVTLAYGIWAIDRISEFIFPIITFNRLCWIIE